MSVLRVLIFVDPGIDTGTLFRYSGKPSVGMSETFSIKPAIPNGIRGSRVSYTTGPLEVIGRVQPILDALCGENDDDFLVIAHDDSGVFRDYEQLLIDSHLEDVEASVNDVRVSAYVAGEPSTSLSCSYHAYFAPLYS